MNGSGINKNDLVMVVIGIIADADYQTHMIEEAIRDIVKRHVSPKDIDHYFVHAAQFNGNKNQPAEIEKDEGARDAILDEIVALPEKLGLPIVQASIWRDRFSEYQPPLTSHSKRVAMQATGVAFVSAAVENLMHKRFPTESTWIIAEYDNEIKEAALLHHREMKPGHSIYDPQLSGVAQGAFSKLGDSVNFANKPHSAGLQLADVCAWAIKGYYEMRDVRTYRFYESLERNIIVRSSSSLDATKKYVEPRHTISLGSGPPRNIN
jgi:hypothetical protein